MLQILVYPTPIMTKTIHEAIKKNGMERLEEILLWESLCRIRVVAVVREDGVVATPLPLVDAAAVAVALDRIMVLVSIECVHVYCRKVGSKVGL